MNGASIATTLAFALYLFGMLAIGLVAWYRTRDIADYFLGGRRLGPWVAALSAGASDMSGWLLLGLPGYAYVAGLEAGWIAVGLLLGTWLNWRFVAARLRTATVTAADALTLPEYLENCFADRSHILRVVAAFFVLLFFTFYTSAGLVAGGKLFNTVFGVSYPVAVMIGTGAILAYTLFGGFLAVSWTDVVQALLMVGALVAAPAMAITALDGVSPMLGAIESANPSLLNPFTGKDGQPLGLIAVLSLLGWGLGYFGQPHILARFMAIRTTNELGYARRIGVTWTFIGLLGALLVGWAGIGFIRPPLDAASTETVFMVLVNLLFHPLVAGFCLAAILAAIMSTADSQLLVASSALTEDFYRQLIRPQAGAHELLWAGRLTVLATSIIAAFLALDPKSQVLELVAYAWAGFGAAFGPVILLSLYWPGTTRHGAVAGIVTGGVTVIVWKNLTGGIFDLYEIIPAFFLSLLAIFATSKLLTARQTAM